MGKLINNQKGFTVIETLLVILILTVIGFGGYYVWHSQHKTSPPKVKATTSAKNTSTKSQQAGSQYSGWPSFCSKVGELCLKYPTTWKYTQSVYPEGELAVGTEVDRITSPSGNVTVLYMPAYEGPSGTGSSETIGVESVTPALSSDFEAVLLKENLSGSYRDEYFVTTKSNDAKSLPGNTTAFTQGGVITGSYIGTYYGFSNPKKPTAAPQRQKLAITQKDSSETGTNIFSTLNDANAWFNSTEVQTAGQILASVTYSQ